MRTAVLIVFQTLLLFAMILCTSDIQLVWTEEVAGTVVRVIPGEIVLGSPALEDVVGTTFAIAVVVENVEDLRAFDVQLNWSMTYLRYDSHVVTVPVEEYSLPISPSSYAGVLHHPYTIFRNTIDETNNIAGAMHGTMGWWSYSQTAPSESFNGNGTVVILSFIVKAQPLLYELPYDVDHVNLTIHFVSTALGDSAAMLIPHTTEDGNIKLYARYPSPDINNDGVVDIYDVVIAANAYGSRIGDSNWNQLADLCPERGKIDLFDLVTLAYHYGETYP